MPVEINWPIIVIACIFMLLDIISGFAAAAKNHEIDSQKMKQGIWHKCGFLLTIAFGTLCEITSQFVDLGYTLPVQSAVCALIICTEIVSITENLGKISPELAGSKLLQLFKNKK